MLRIYERLTAEIVGRESEIKSILLAMRAGKHILLEGPPGTSKSTLLTKIAIQSHIPYYSIEGNSDLTPAKLTGHFNPAKIMHDTYRPRYFEKGPLALAMEEGGILYIDEFNRMPTDVANILITPMEEGDIHIPRYGIIKAGRRFTVIAARNPYDDVGTVRVSRAFMDRICLVKTGYQSEAEELEIVRIKTGLKHHGIEQFAVRMVRRTRSHPDVKQGASIRAAIDMLELFVGMQKLSDQPVEHFLSAARMALSNRICLNEISSRTADDIISDIWCDLKEMFQAFSDRKGPVTVAILDPENIEQPQQEVQEVLPQEIRPFRDERHDLERTGIPPLDPESNDPHDYWRLAHYFNDHPEALEQFFQRPGSLKAFSRMTGRLTDDVAAQAVRIASRLIMKIARQIADTGYRSGKLKLVRGFTEGADIELDNSLECYAQAPERGMLDSLVTYARHKEKSAFVMMLDHSYSMQSNIILAAITAAAIAQHFKNDYAVLAFGTDVCVLREVDESSGPETVLGRLFALQPHGETNIRMALEAGLGYVNKFERKSGLILTDGDWNRGGNPFQAAVRFDKLSVIAFPPASHEKIQKLALQGNGNFSFVKEESEIAEAIIRCLN